MAGAAQLPIVDLSSPDRISTANSIRQACIDYGFFYLVNHGVEQELFSKVFEESKKFFSLPLNDKMKLSRKHHRGYTPLYAENLDPLTSPRGDSKEGFYVGPVEGATAQTSLNQWPAQELLPSWRPTMESYHKKVMSAARKLISLIALALNLDECYFEKVGALDAPNGFLRLLHYPGELGCSGEEIYGASAHSDYGMITLLVSDGVPGLQVCREKFNQPRLWEDVLHRNGAFIVNIGDMMERWTNCLFRSTLHRVMPTGHERYSFTELMGLLPKQLYRSFEVVIPNCTFRCYPADLLDWLDWSCLYDRLLLKNYPYDSINQLAFFLDPDPNCVVECLKSCCSESNPPRFPPIRSGAYLEERLRLSYG